MAEQEKKEAVLVFGLKNCDSCRKATKWLESEGIEFSFHDVRADGLDRQALDRWIARVGWETLLNRKSTTWRGLDDADKSDVDEAAARRLMLANPTLVKRPVIEVGRHLHVGFGPKVQEELSS